MKHYEFEISLFVENELPKEEIEDLNNHLSTCLQCRKTLTDYILIKDEIKNFYEKLPDKVIEKQKNNKELILHRCENISATNGHFYERVKRFLNFIKNQKILIQVTSAAVIIFFIILFRIVGTGNNQYEAKHDIPSNQNQLNGLTYLNNKSTLKKNELNQIGISRRNISSRMYYMRLHKHSQKIKVNNYEISIEEFNFAITNAIRAQNDTITNMRLLLSLGKNIKYQGNPIMTDSTLIQQDIETSN